MKKKSGKKKEKTGGKDAKKKTSYLSGQDEAEYDGKQVREGFEFGGLPDRDLKKNLGCGS